MLRRRQPRRLRPLTPDHQPRPKYRRGRLGVRKETSAGGVAVRTEDGAHFVALLKTAHKKGQVWVLPKGHVEEGSGERASAAARREVMEEAGLKDLSVKDQLGITRFRFQAESAVVHKTVHYFLMTTGQKQLTPQAEEDILEAKWFPIAEAIEVLEYDTDQEIVRRAQERLTGVKVARPAGRDPLRRPRFAGGDSLTGAARPSGRSQRPRRSGPSQTPRGQRKVRIIT